MEAAQPTERKGANGAVIVIATAVSLFSIWKFAGFALVLTMGEWLPASVPVLIAISAAALVCAAIQPDRWLPAALYCGLPAWMCELFILMAFLPSPMPSGYFWSVYMNAALIAAAAFGGALAGRLLRTHFGGRA
jgi:hypothetical protein